MQPGDIITRQMLNAPMFNHYGVFLYVNGQPFAIHKQSDRGHVLEPLSKFLKGHPLRASFKTPLSGKSSTQILELYKSSTPAKFNLIFSNCEKFANDITGNNYKAKELLKASFFLLATIGIFAAIIYAAKTLTHRREVVA